MGKTHTAGSGSELAVDEDRKKNLHGSEMIEKWLQKETEAVREKLRPSPLPALNAWPSLPMVSVLVAAWNEEDQISEFLEGFDRIDYPNKELLLVAGGNDATFERAQTAGSSSLKLIQQRAGEGKFLALKKGISHAAGEVIFLTDADCRIDPEHFKRLIFPIATESAGATTGPVWPLPQQLKVPFVRAQLVNLFRKMHMVPDPSVPFLFGANCAIKRDLLEDCLGGSANQSIGEDYYVALCLRKRGLLIQYDHAGGIETRYPQSFMEYVRQKSRWHRSYLLLHHQFGDKTWIINALSSIGHQLLLIMPFAILIPGPVGVIVWLLSWSVMFVPYVKAIFITRSLEQKSEAVFLSMLQLMLADFCARAVCLPQIATKRLRHRW
jgi:cellulose synthase/poly-beta-1,6-N-acetylglucosamine synthase-like glycosyltransferase